MIVRPSRSGTSRTSFSGTLQLRISPSSSPAQDSRSTAFAWKVPSPIKALLRAGWASASLVRTSSGPLVPWSILARARKYTDAAVQEAILALPYAYSNLEVHGRAAVLVREGGR